MNSSQSVMETCSTMQATQYAKLLLGCFRRGEAEDGAIYVRSVVTILTMFPENIVKSVCDPRTGLPSSKEFLPTIYDIRQACEARLAPLVRAERQRLRSEQDEADRPLPRTPEEIDRRRKVVDEERRRIGLPEMTRFSKMPPGGQPTQRVRGETAKSIGSLATDITRPLVASPALLASMGIKPVQRPPQAQETAIAEEDNTRDPDLT